MTYFDNDGFEYYLGGTTLISCPVDFEGVCVIPKNVVSINEEAFFEREKITSVYIPEGVKEIKSRTFQNCTSLQSVYLPQSLKHIGFAAFWDCPNLEKIRIPDNIEKIDSYAFKGCHKLRSIYIPGRFTYIDEDAFDECQNLTSIDVDPENINYRSIDGVLFWKFGWALYLKRCPQQMKGKYILPKECREIGGGAFQDCKYITSIVLPDAISNIYESAFRGCDNLKNIVVSEAAYDRISKIEGLIPFANKIIIQK